MVDSREVDIAIIGAGASGSLLCVQLARLWAGGAGAVGAKAAGGAPELDRGAGSGGPPTVALIDADGEAFGRGLAYQVDGQGLLLNTTVARTTPLPDDPYSFARFVRLPRAAFAFRADLGAHLSDLLVAAEAVVPIARRAGRVVELTAGGQLRLSSGEVLRAQQVVLALGNLRPSPLPELRSLPGAPRSLPAWPWDLSAIDDLPPDQSVAAIGTGLSFVDLVASLLNRGHRGPIFGLSRHGWLPQAHPPFPPERPPQLPPPRGLRPILRWARGHGPDFRQAVDALRPVSQELWEGLTDAERRRFNRHLENLWNTHRHRMAPGLAERIAAARASQQLEVVAGRVRGVTRAGGRLLLRYWPRGSRQSQLVAADRLLSTIGPATGRRHPLLRALARRGLLRWTEFGLDLAPDGQVRANTPGVPMFVLGPLRRGTSFETISIPEIGLQAEALARALLGRVAG